MERNRQFQIIMQRRDDGWYVLVGVWEGPYARAWAAERVLALSRLYDESRNPSNADSCRCWNEGEYGRVHREGCPIHSNVSYPCDCAASNPSKTGHLSQDCAALSAE